MTKIGNLHGAFTPLDPLGPGGGLEQLSPGGEVTAGEALDPLQQRLDNLDNLHAQALQADPDTGALLGQTGKAPPSTSYTGSKGGVLGLLRQVGQRPAGDGPAPFRPAEIQARLAATEANLQAAQQGAGADPATMAQAQQDLQRAGASLQQPGLEALQEQLGQLIELLVQLMLAFGMSPGEIDETLGRAMGSAGGWGGPSGGYASSPPAGRPAGGRWSNSAGGGAAPGSYKTESWKPVTDPAPAGFGVNKDQLTRIVPGLAKDPAKAEAVTGQLNKAMHEAGITDPKEQAAFIAQLAHESGGFKYMEEIASGSAYEGRKDLGNTQPGDGQRFKGRGPIQLTGRANYRAAGKALGLDLENNPQLAATPEVGFRTAAWYWKTRGCGEAARAGDFRAVTKKINGGYNGLADRQQYYQRALAALG